MFETFDHTADVGLRAQATDPEKLFVAAAEGLFTLIAGDLASIRPVELTEFKLASDQLDLLFFDWLNELLYAYETRHLLLSRFAVQIGETELTAQAWGEPVDPARHRLEHEVKAITYHDLKVEQTANGWLAEVILDI